MRLLKSYKNFDRVWGNFVSFLDSEEHEQSKNRKVNGYEERNYREIQDLKS